MAVFKYVAISRSGTKITGDIDAENIRIARYLLYKKHACLKYKKEFYFLISMWSKK